MPENFIDGESTELLQTDVADSLQLNLVEQDEFEANYLQKTFAAVVALISVFAALPVPYLTFRSVEFLYTGKNDIMFAEAADIDDPWFWGIAISISILSTMAVAPFNIYNSYKLATSKTSAPSKAMFKKALLYSPLSMAGVVNAYNMRLAYDEMLAGGFGPIEITRPLSIGIGFFFAAFDARVFVQYVKSDLPRDFRYLKRLASSNRPCFWYTSRQFMPLEDRISRSKLKIKLDDLYILCRLGLSENHIASLDTVLKGDSTLQIVENVVALQAEFPFSRFMVSEVFGSLVSILWAGFGNANTLQYAHDGITEYLKYIGISNNFALSFFGNTGAAMGYTVTGMMTCFLIRDLFFRECAQKRTKFSFDKFFKHVALPFIPAFCFGLLNLIMTTANPGLSVAEKFFVAPAAMIGATVVLRYAIDGGIREWRGETNARLMLTGKIKALQDKLSSMDDGALQSLSEVLDSPLSNGVEPT